MLCANILARMQELFVRSDGTLLEHHKVEQIQPGSPVKVVTSKGVLNALQVVITAGMCVCDSFLYMLCVCDVYVCWRRLFRGYMCCV